MMIFNGRRQTQEEREREFETVQKITSFEFIWEQDAQWVMGRSILGDIVKHLKGKCLECTFDKDQYSANVSLPFPTVKDEISGQQVPIVFLIPDTLMDRFVRIVNNIIQLRYRSKIELLLESYIKQSMRPTTLAEINIKLRQMEDEAYSNTGISLADVAATEFGLGPRACFVR